MESLINILSYDRYRRYFVAYQVIATVLICIPIFLSVIILIGLPHLFFLILNILLAKGSANWTRRVLHAIMFVYYGGLLIIALQMWPEIIHEWNHPDSIDKLIQVQLTFLPFILVIQLPLLAFEWVYPVMLPHEVLERESRLKKNHS